MAMVRIVVQVLTAVVAGSILSVFAAEFQMTPRSIDSVAEQLTRRAVCEAYYTSHSRDNLFCDWFDVPLEDYLAFLSLEFFGDSAERAKNMRLPMTLERIEASLILTSLWSLKVVDWSYEVEAANRTGIQIMIERKEAGMLDKAAKNSDGLRKVSALAAELVVLPTFARLADQVVKVRQLILQELKLRPDVLKRFQDRGPLAPELVQGRKTIAALIVR